MLRVEGILECGDASPLSKARTCHVSRVGHGNVASLGPRTPYSSIRVDSCSFVADRSPSMSEQKRSRTKVRVHSREIEPRAHNGSCALAGDGATGTRRLVRPPGRWNHGHPRLEVGIDLGAETGDNGRRTA